MVIFTEQTEIAKRLGISNKAFRRIVHGAGIDNEKYYKLINNKRHYDFNFIIKILENGK